VGDRRRGRGERSRGVRGRGARPRGAAGGPGVRDRLGAGGGGGRGGAHGVAPQRRAVSR
jgi:hypothetical protein